MTICKHRVKPRWETEVKWKFAFFPTRDWNKDWFWLERYWYWTDLQVCARCRHREYDTKEKFWNRLKKENIC